MKTHKKTRILHETHEALSLRRHVQVAPREAHGWCDLCLAEVQFLVAEDAALTAGVGARQIYRMVENGQIHFNETPAGLVLICMASLNDFLASGLTRNRQEMQYGGSK